MFYNVLVVLVISFLGSTFFVAVAARTSARLPWLLGGLRVVHDPSPRGWPFMI